MNRSATFAGSFVFVCLGCAVAVPPLFAGQVDLLNLTKPATLQALAGAVGAFIGVVSGLYAFRSQPPLDKEQTAKVVDRALDKKNVATGADIDRLERLLTDKAGLSDEQARRVLGAFGETLSSQPIDPAEYETRLLALAKQFIDQLAQAEVRTNDRPEIAAFRADAAVALRDARFADARALFARIAEAHLETGAYDVLAGASAIAEEGGASRLLGDLTDAASKYGRAAELAAPFDAEAAWSWRMAQADILDDHGKLFPGPSQAEAARIWRDLCLPHTPRETRPADWAMTQNNLGIALRTLGQRSGGEAGTKALSDAVAAYEAALEVYTREAMSADWAMTQNNLGIALQTLGERSGGEVGTKALSDAVVAYEAALDVYTRETRPADWAMTQNNLGNALQTLGERSGGEAGTKALSDAVVAYEAALDVYTREAMPADWAMTQNNLGVALQTLGARSGGEAGTKALSDAVVAYEAALDVYTRETRPADWAMTQNNLGNALQTLGARSGGEAGTKALSDAVVAYEAALDVYTREAMPADRAMTQNNLGNALSTLGERSGGEAGTKALSDAVVAYEAALEVRTREAMPVDWAITTENVCIAHESLSDISGDPAPVCAAADRMMEVIRVFEAMQAEFYIDKARRDRARMIALCHELGGTCAD